MVMRVGGLATGMDLEAIIQKLMTAERMPLDRLEQNKTYLTWQRDAFRDINKKLLEFDNMMLDMQLSKTYQTKTVSSTNETAVTARGSSSSVDGNYTISVQQLATTAMNAGETLEIDPNKKFGELAKNGVDVPLGDFKFYTFNEKTNKMEEHLFTITKDDNLDAALKKINAASDNVRATYDKTANRVILESKRTGDYNTTSDFSGAEIGFYAVDGGEGKEQNSFFTNILKLSATGEVGGKNAKFTYNSSLEIESKKNEYELNNIVFQFNNTTSENVRITITNDTDHSVNAIKNFVNKYNEIVEMINGTQQEEKFRSYRPLTEEQKKDMSEEQIKKWEEQAKSGILRGESILTNGVASMRQSWYKNIDTDGEYTSITSLGISTSANYFDGGKLEMDDEQLRQILSENPEDVRKLFSGLVDEVRTSLKSTMNKVEEKAGKGSSTLDNYAIGKRMKDIDKQITAFEARMVKVENRYWNQYTAMEKAIQRMNDQSAQLMSQLGGMF